MIRPSLLLTAVILVTILQVANLAVPTQVAQVASLALQPHGPIFINGNTEFAPANGVVGGNGTAQNPYIIDGWLIDTSSTNAITIKNTNAYFLIQNVKVQSTAHNVTGVVFDNISNGRLENSTVLDDFNGLRINGSSGISISNNTFSDNPFSINLYASSNISFTDNKIRNTVEGITIYYSTNISLQRNIFGSSGVFIQGSTVAQFDSHNITLDNLVNGNPVYYYKDCGPQTIRDMTIGQLIVANCSQFEAENLRIENSTVGVEMAFVNNSLIAGGKISLNSLYGIYLFSPMAVTVAGNDVSSNLGFGIRLESARNATVASNNIASNSEYGLFFYNSQGVRVYHNNITSNRIQAFDSGGSGNVWDNGYSVGGNHWSDYTGSDNCSGVAQNVCPPPDGIGDTPYLIAQSGVDRYPLTQPVLPDASPPSWPAGSNLMPSNIGHENLTLTWSEATDNVGVVMYRIYQEGGLIVSLTASVHDYNVTGLTPGTSHTFKVEAGDSSNNWSSDGPSTSAMTKTSPMLDPIGPKTVDEETTLSFQVTATDPDGDALFFSLGNVPPLASITSEGSFEWTPIEAQGPGTYPIAIIVSDGVASDSETFVITVQEVNTPPVIGPVGDRSVSKGGTLTFRVNASDTDIPVEALIFTLATSATGRFPEGATLTTDGAFSWTPRPDQAGNYTVRVVVADGQEDSSLEFTITVSEDQAQGPVFSAWVPWAAVGAVGLVAVGFAFWLRSKRRVPPA